MYAAAAKEHIENVAKPTEPKVCAGLLLHSLVAIVVIKGAFFLVGEHLVGLIYFFKAVLGFVVIWVDVGMMLSREAPIGALDVSI